MKSIGSTYQAASTILRRSGLAPFRHILPAREFRRVARQAGCTPKRKRALVPEVVVWLMAIVALETTSMTQGLLRAWGLVGPLCPARKRGGVSEEAFTQARKGLPLRFWKVLWLRLRSRYEQRFASLMRWKGIWRVLAVDGSDVLLPHSPALSRFFGHPKGSKGEGRQPQGRLVGMCSVFTGFCVAFKFMPLRFTEHAALRHLIRHLKKNDLLLLDRGFFSLPGPLGHHPAKRSVLDAGFQPGSPLCPAYPAIGTLRMDRAISPAVRRAA